MKKLFSIALILILALSFTISAAAASAYSTIKITGEDENISIKQNAGNDWFTYYKLTDDDKWEVWDGQGDKTDYYIGGSRKTDAIIIKNVDFGENGPASVKVLMSSNPDGLEGVIGLYVDGNKIAEVKAKGTGGWTKFDYFTSDVTGSVTGVKALEIRYENDSGGNVREVIFTEKAAGSSETSESEPKPKPENIPQTADAFSLTLFALISATGITGLFVTKKTK